MKARKLLACLIGATLSTRPKPSARTRRANFAPEVWSSVFRGLRDNAKHALGMCLTIFAINAASAETAPLVRERALTSVESLRFEEAVDLGLRDPESAKFRDVVIVESPHQVSICGLVNSKNAFGGYTGYLPFMAFLKDDGDTFAVGDDDLMFNAIETICSAVRSSRDSS